MYLYIAGRWYFLVTFIDGYSRYILNWRLGFTMRADEIEAFARATLARYPGERLAIVHDSGSQFVSKDFKRLLRQFQLKDIRIKIAHPQSNGIRERWYHSLRTEALDEHDPRSYHEAYDCIAQWVEYYNTERLHASLHYLPPMEYVKGTYRERLTEREEKLRMARKRRIEINRQCAKEVNAALKDTNVKELKPQSIFKA